MKHMGAVGSDSVKSAMKDKDKLHKACECQKIVSNLCMGRNKTMRMASMRESRDSDQFLVNTSTITCTAAPRVWHFIAFHFVWQLFHSLTTSMYYTNIFQ